MTFIESLKKGLFYIGLFFTTLLFIALYTTYYKLDSKINFLYVLIVVHFVVFIIAILLERKVFKKRRHFIKVYLDKVWKLAIVGMFIHSINIIIMLSEVHFTLNIYNQFVVMAGLFISAMMLQKLSFFNVA